MIFEKFQFATPQWLWLLILVVLLAVWYFFYQNKVRNYIKLPTTKGFEIKHSLRGKLRHLLFILRLLAIALIIISLAKPQIENLSVKQKTTKGIDIVMAIDVSHSMLAKDLKPNRLGALKKVAIKFINERQNDRIGITVYAGESFTKVPLTTDKKIIIKAVKNIHHGKLEAGTAIGMGLATAINRLKNSQAKSKIIILLTDGENNSGFIDPETANELAVEYDIKAYTIGIGTNGYAESPVAIYPDGSFQFKMTEVKIDETLLRNIAKNTGGKYFRATNNQSLENIYSEINKLETTELEVTKYYNYDKKYRILTSIAFLLLILELLFRYTIFRSFI